MHTLERTISTLTKRKRKRSELCRKYVRFQLVHISKRTSEPIVSCYYVRLRRSSLDLTSLDSLKVAINLSCVKTSQFQRSSWCICKVYVKVNSSSLLPIQIRALSSSPFLPLDLCSIINKWLLIN